MDQIGPHPAEAVAAAGAGAAGQGDHGQVQLGDLLDGDPVRRQQRAVGAELGVLVGPQRPAGHGIVQPLRHLRQQLGVEKGAAWS